jgi:hypothetical protein
MAMIIPTALSPPGEIVAAKGALKEWSPPKHERAKSSMRKTAAATTMGHKWIIFGHNRIRVVRGSNETPPRGLS